MPDNSDAQRYSEFMKIVERVYGLLERKIGNKLDLYKVIVDGDILKDHLSDEYKAKPESFTKENIIEEFLEFLGYGIESRAGESELKKAFGINYPDYKLIASQDFYALVEAEPLNTNLYSEDHGVKQVENWIGNKACTTDYGIATEGFRWILIEYSLEKSKTRKIKEVDLSIFFKEKMGIRTLRHEKDKK
jgi:predicted type IV restriction endonuclease